MMIKFVFFYKDQGKDDMHTYISHLNKYILCATVRELWDLKSLALGEHFLHTMLIIGVDKYFCFETGSYYVALAGMRSTYCCLSTAKPWE